MKDVFKSIFVRHYGRSFNEKSRALIDALSPAEKAVFWAAALVLIFTSTFVVLSLNDSIKVVIPARGGAITEGIVGSPHSINPVLATSETDLDLTSLIYAGLTRADAKGNVIPELASSYEVSEDRRTYIFTLHEGVTFHDGTPITTEDVEFTIKKALDPALKSARRAQWEGVTIEKIDTRKIKFVLTQPYAPFLEGTTLGILPKNIWRSLSAEQFISSPYNTDPTVGSGPYMLTATEKGADNTLAGYTLESFKKYVLGQPYISMFYVNFYKNQAAALDAYDAGTIDSLASVSPEYAYRADPARTDVIHATLPRVFGVFFNQNQAPSLAQPEIREALDTVVDRERIVKDVFGGYAKITDTVLPVSFFANSATAPATATTTSLDERIAAAQISLEKNGWTRNLDGFYEKKGKTEKETLTFSFTLTTINAPDLVKTANILKENWEKIGAAVDIKLFDQGDINQTVLQPRKYQAFLFGEIIGRDLDLFAFWHSSQRNHPGLNIALYANSKADRYLEDARTATTTEAQRNSLLLFEKETRKDIPAILLYSPDLIYFMSKDIHHEDFKTITTPSERFGNISEWFRETEKVWDADIFKKPLIK